MDRLAAVAERVASLLRRDGWQARTITLRLRYADFTTISRSQTLTRPTDLADTVYGTGVQLLRREWRGQRPVRLISIGASNLVAAAAVQPSLFDAVEEGRRAERRAALARTVDRIRERFGRDSLRRAKTIRRADARENGK